MELEGVVVLLAHRPGKALVGLGKLLAYLTVVVQIAFVADRALQSSAVLVHLAAGVRWMHSGHHDQTRASSVLSLLLDGPVLVRAIVSMEALGRWTLSPDQEPVRRAFDSQAKVMEARHGHRSS